MALSTTFLNTRVLRVVNVVGYIVLIIINALAGSGRLNGKTNADMSQKYSTPLTPAG